MGIVALEGIRFFAHHGVHEHEKKDGNTFEVDVYMYTDRISGLDDEVEHTVDYEHAWDEVKAVMETNVNLLETIVEEIGKRILSRIEAVDRVKVRVSKLNPPLGSHCLRSYVEADYAR